MVKYVSKDIICAKMMHCNFRSPDMTVSDFINDELPAADVQPVRHGEWEDERYDDDLLHCYIATCSECGYESTDRYRISDSHKYCENCGVKMDQKE